MSMMKFFPHIIYTCVYNFRYYILLVSLTFANVVHILYNNNNVYVI